MEIMVKIKNEEKISHASPISIICDWRENDVVNVQQDNAYILTINSMFIGKRNIEYIPAQKDHKHRH